MFIIKIKILILAEVLSIVFLKQSAFTEYSVYLSCPADQSVQLWVKSKLVIEDF